MSATYLDAMLFKGNGSINIAFKGPGVLVIAPNTVLHL